MVHTKLEVWKRSIDLSVKIYQITDLFPATEKYSLCQQIRKCAVSIPSNIAEGAGRQSSNELKQFINYSIGSLSELETQLIISSKLNFLKKEDNNLFAELTEIRRMLQAIVRTLNNKSNPKNH